MSPPITGGGFAAEPLPMVDRLFNAAKTRQCGTIEAARTMIGNIQGQLDNALKDVDEAEKYLKDRDADTAMLKMGYAVDKLQLLRNREVAHVVDGINRIRQNMRNALRNNGREVTREQIESAVKALESEFQSVTIGTHSCYPGKECLLIRTHDIILNHELVTASEPRTLNYNFGPFDIVIDLNGFETRIPKPYKCWPVTPDTRGGFIYHPHIDSGSLCEGNAGNVLAQVLDACDFYAFALIINQTMNNYNPGSPYQRLEVWIDQPPRSSNREYLICPRCDDEVAEDDGCWCVGCDCLFHVDCLEYCETRDTYICEHCLDAARDRNRGCNGCDSIGQSECLVRVDETCAGCEEHRPPEELHYCNLGSRNVCDGCIGDASEEGPCGCCNLFENRECVLTRLGNVTVGELTDILNG